jgi:hypothetical protein
MAKDPSKLLPGALASDPNSQLLASFLKMDEPERQAPDRILRRPIGATVPLSFAQERLWFLQQWEPNNPAYNITRAYRLKGALDRAALARSVEAIAERHEALRSIFPIVGDQPVQEYLPESALALRCIDLSRREAPKLSRRIATEARQAFDLATGPLLRLSLYRCAADDHVLVLVAHQSIFDGRSVDLFYRELEALYAAGGDAEQTILPALSVQYGDYALWQRAQDSNTALAAQLAYWKARLAGALPALELPTDRPRPAQSSFKGARRKIVIDEKLTAALKDLSRKSNTTLFVTLMAAYNVLLHRYTNEEDFVVGFPVATRDRPQLENLIGSFVNTLPLRRNLAGAPSFRNLLAQIRAAVQEALKHTDLPFERLVEELSQSRDYNLNPVFQTMFTFQNRLPADLTLAGIKAEPIDCDTGGAKFDLTLALGERDGRLSGSFEYRTDLFDGSTINRMVAHFITLLKGIATDAYDSDVCSGSAGLCRQP